MLNDIFHITKHKITPEIGVPLFFILKIMTTFVGIRSIWCRPYIQQIQQL